MEMLGEEQHGNDFNIHKTKKQKSSSSSNWDFLSQESLNKLYDLYTTNDNRENKDATRRNEEEEVKTSTDDDADQANEDDHHSMKKLNETKQRRKNKPIYDDHVEQKEQSPIIKTVSRLSDKVRKRDFAMIDRQEGAQVMSYLRFLERLLGPDSMEVANEIVGSETKAMRHWIKVVSDFPQIQHKSAGWSLVGKLIVIAGLGVRNERDLRKGPIHDGVPEPLFEQVVEPLLNKNIGKLSLSQRRKLLKAVPGFLPQDMEYIRLRFSIIRKEILESQRKIADLKKQFEQTNEAVANDIGKGKSRKKQKAGTSTQIPYGTDDDDVEPVATKPMEKRTRKVEPRKVEPRSPFVVSRKPTTGLDREYLFRRKMAYIFLTEKKNWEVKTSKGVFGWKYQRPDLGGQQGVHMKDYALSEDEVLQLVEDESNHMRQEFENFVSEENLAFSNIVSVKKKKVIASSSSSSLSLSSLSTTSKDIEEDKLVDFDEFDLYTLPNKNDQHNETLKQSTSAEPPVKKRTGRGGSRKGANRNSRKSSEPSVDLTQIFKIICENEANNNENSNSNGNLPSPKPARRKRRRSNNNQNTTGSKRKRTTPPNDDQVIIIDEDVEQLRIPEDDALVMNPDKNTPTPSLVNRNPSSTSKSARAPRKAKPRSKKVQIKNEPPEPKRKRIITCIIKTEP